MTLSEALDPNLAASICRLIWVTGECIFNPVPFPVHGAINMEFNQKKDISAIAHLYRQLLEPYCFILHSWSSKDDLTDMFCAGQQTSMVKKS